jgi:hypothetical protein
MADKTTDELQSELADMRCERAEEEARVELRMEREVEKRDVEKLCKDSDSVDLKNSLLKACINRLAPSQAAGILDEIPELLERGFPDEWSASQILWSYTD